MAIINLTQHNATPEQIAAGVRDLPAERAANLRSLLTFEEVPTQEEIRRRARAIAEIAVSEGVSRALIGGAPYLCGPLEAALRERGIVPLYAFSRREVEEVRQPDGSVRKTAVFRHIGFVEGTSPS